MEHCLGPKLESSKIFGLDFPLGILTLVPALSVMMMMMMMGWDDKLKCAEMC